MAAHDKSVINRVFLDSSQYDATKAGIGSSSLIGDLSSTCIAVPPDPTIAQNRRYLFRLCGIAVPSKTVCVIRHLRQLLYIGADIETEDGQPDEHWLLEVPVTDPLWCFPNGNVSWHLRRSTYRRPDSNVMPNVFIPLVDTAPAMGYSFRPDTNGPALLAILRADGFSAYIPTNSGVVYGDPIAGLGTFRDIRFPWSGEDRYLGIQIEGPCNVQFFASIYQTDPAERPNKPVLIESAGLRKEDVFMLNYPTARYTRVGGLMEIDLVSPEEAKNYPVR